MDYKKLYDDLIAFRQQNPASGYTENHHIVMRSMGGSDDKSNLVKLTGREHWIAHLLLYKIHRSKQTAHACHMMAMKSEERGIPQVRNSRMYEAIRKECARLIGIQNSKLKGSKNSQFGTQWISNIDLKESKKISKEDEIPEGWILGRNKWNQNINLVCLACSKSFTTSNKNRKYCSSSCWDRSHFQSAECREKISKQCLESKRNAGTNNGKHKAKIKRLQNALVSELCSKQ